MSQVYFSSFDLAVTRPGSVTLSRSGSSDISVNLAAFTAPCLFNPEARSSRFNPVISASTSSFDQYASIGLAALAAATFFAAITTELQNLAAGASWPNAQTLVVSLDPADWRVSFDYTGGALTAIAFGDVDARRMFGFATDFSGSASSVTGTELPKYILFPAIDGAASASVVYEDAAVSSGAYSGAGQPFGLARSATARKRDWVQTYESIEATFRRHASVAPNEFTYQDLFENSRPGLPFAVLDFGDGAEGAYHVYSFDGGEFVARPATPGNADQFHVDFHTFALGYSPVEQEEEDMCCDDVRSLILARPVAPHADNDEFETGVLNGAWSWWRGLVGASLVAATGANVAAGTIAPFTTPSPTAVYSLSRRQSWLQVQLDGSASSNGVQLLKKITPTTGQCLEAMISVPYRNAALPVSGEMRLSFCAWQDNGSNAPDGQNGVLIEFLMNPAASGYGYRMHSVAAGVFTSIQGTAGVITSQRFDTPYVGIRKDGTDYSLFFGAEGWHMHSDEVTKANPLPWVGFAFGTAGSTGAGPLPIYGVNWFRRRNDANYLPW